MKVVGFNAGAFFRVALHEVRGIDALHDLLQRVEHDPLAFIIRSYPALENLPLDKKKLYRRRKKENGGVFVAAAQPWIILDLDTWPLPEGLHPVRDKEHIIAWVRSQLPVELQNVTMIVQFSSSYGPKLGLAKLHLYFWLDRPMTYAQLKRWLGVSFPPDLPVDPMPLTDVQPIWVARPVFEDGAEDPMPGSRLVLVRGARDVASLPDVPRLERRIARVASERGVSREALLADMSDIKGWQSKLGVLGDGLGRRGFHVPLLSAAAAYVVARGAAADAEVFKVKARRAINAAPKVPGRAGDIERYNSDAYLNGLLDSAQEKLQQGVLLRSTRSFADLRPDEVPPIKGPAYLPLDEARERLDTAIAATFRRIVGYLEAPGAAGLHEDPPQLGAMAGVGVGKTGRAIEAIVVFLAANPDQRVVYVVPAHGLADEVVRRLNDAASAPIARSWRGLDQSDPDVRMCRRHHKARNYLEAGGSIERLCGSPQRGWCRHHPKNEGRTGPACAYATQRTSTAQAWVLPFAMLGNPPPRSLAREGRPVCDLMVVDEGPWTGLIGGCGDTVYTVPLAWLTPEAWPEVPDRDGDLPGAARAKVHAVLSSVYAVLEPAPMGEVADEALGIGGTPVANVTECEAAAGLLWRCKVDIDRPAQPNMTGEELDALAAEASAVNCKVAKVARLLSVLAARLRGGPAALLRRTVAVDAMTGQMHPAVALRWRQDLHVAWSSCPVLYIDATAQVDLARCWLPRLELVGEVHADAPHAATVQLTDSVFGYKSLVGDDEAAAANRAMVGRIIGQLGRRCHGLGAGAYDVLVGLPLAVRRTMEALDAHNRPVSGAPRAAGDRVGLLHYGVERGVDAYGGVVCSPSSRAPPLRRARSRRWRRWPTTARSSACPMTPAGTQAARCGGG